MKIVTVEQMQAIERSANAAGLSYETMMHNAGCGIADWVYRHIFDWQSVIGLVGSGNNGGDTIIALNCLAKRGLRTIAFLLKDRGEDPLLETYILNGGAVVDLSGNENLDVFQAALVPGTVVLDGVLGTGLKLPLRGSLQEMMANIRKLLRKRLDLLIIAVDCPSGVDCDTGEVSEVTIRADHTLTMAAVKQGLLRHPARSFTGDLHYVGIGIDELSKHLSADLPVMIDGDEIGANFPERPKGGHKGTFGTCLILAGSAPYTGAAYLTGKSAYRAGCGLVNMAAIKDVHHCLSGRLIEAVWTLLPDITGAYDTLGVEILRQSMSTADTMVLGPGWGLSDQNAEFLQALLHNIPINLPTLFDADGLKLLTQIKDWWTLLPEKSVLTPHPGEMSVLTGLETDQIQSNRWEIARHYAELWDVVLVLKGAMTVVAAPGKDVHINPISDAALATAGSGDVLSGVIGSLMAQGVSAHAASVLGVWLHGQAGLLAGNKLGTDLSVTALDILDCLPDAIVKAKEAGG
jgi:ADP-dependent NAD(P)H-hydrate dehydratase / NAD(P)H-hydrate epimerase